MQRKRRLLIILLVCGLLRAEDKPAAVPLVPALFLPEKPDSSALVTAKPPLDDTTRKLSLAGNSGDAKPMVRLVAVETNVAKRYRVVVPPLPFPPFTSWRHWIQEHEKASHCVLEWCNEKGEWSYGELRSMTIDKKIEQYRVGTGEFPGTAYHAYGVYIFPGPMPRDVDQKGERVRVMYEEKIDCDFKRVEQEIRNYAAKYAQPGDPGTGGKGENNVGLGGPAYKPAQNSNTMIHYVLRACGVEHSTPPLAVGWDTVPHFPCSSDADMASQ